MTKATQVSATHRLHDLWYLLHVVDIPPARMESGEADSGRTLYLSIHLTPPIARTRYPTLWNDFSHHLDSPVGETNEDVTMVDLLQRWE